MGVLQDEISEVMEMWNTHIIRQDRSRLNVGGVPDELFFIPEIRGSYTTDSCQMFYCFFGILLL